MNIIGKCRVPMSLRSGESRRSRRWTRPYGWGKMDTWSCFEKVVRLRREQFYRDWADALRAAQLTVYRDVAEGVCWRDSQGALNLVRFDAYSWLERGERPLRPLIFRVFVNDCQPYSLPVGVAGRWRSEATDINTATEITCLPDETEIVAALLPAWLENRLYKRPTDIPAACLSGLMGWPECGYVYYWTPRAARAFDDHMAAHPHLPIRSAT